MECPRLTRWAAVGAAVAVVIVSQAVPQTAPTSAPARGKGGARVQDVAPCFHTTVAAHPYDIILGQPTAGSVVVSVMSTAVAEGCLEWGTTAGQYTGRTETVKLTAGEPVAIRLTGLSPDTQYVYRLQYAAGDSGLTAGPEYRFHTTRAPGKPFTFTVTADWHLDERTNTDLYANTLRNALADGPDFHVDLGDTFMSDKVRGLGQPLLPMYLAQRYYLGLLCGSAPLFFVSGNHDGEIANADPEARALRRRMLPNPTSGDGFDNAYAWTWGDALFIVLDPYTYSAARFRAADDNWNRTLGEAQYRWLQQTLAGSAAPYKFVFVHHLVGGMDKNGRGGAEAAAYFEWGGHSLDGTDEFAVRRLGWEMPIHRLLVKHHVSAVFHGHDHFYDRQELDGIVYQEVPQPGWTGGDRVNQAAEYGYRSGTVLASSGHLRVQVAPAGATVDYVRSVLPAQRSPNSPNRAVALSYRLMPSGTR